MHANPAVACTKIDRVPTAVTIGSDGTVRVWDLRAGRQWDIVERPARALAIAVGRGNVLVAGFGWDVVVLAPGRAGPR